MTLGCTSLQPSSIGTARGDVVWREFRSQHFAVCTDADDNEARESMAELETTYGALRGILFHEEGEVSDPMHVVLFAHGADLHRFVPAVVVAAFSPGQAGDAESKPTMLLETSLSEEGRRFFIHEMTHAFVDRWFGHVPLWLNEGLAQYFEVMRIEKGRVLLGDAAPSVVFAPNQMPALTALLTADPSIFYAGTSTQSVEGLHQQGSFYAAAWYLVRILMQGTDDYHRRFYQYLDALTHRVPPQAAWARSFDGATYRQLARDYSESLRSDWVQTAFVAIEVRPAKEVVRGERIMPAAETRRLWSRLERIAKH